jgi:DNA-binding NarL/FixJ family response regulator
LISVAVVAEDPGVLPRVRRALQREGTAGAVEDGGPPPLRPERLERWPDVVLVGSADGDACIAEAARVRRRVRGAHVVAIAAPGTAWNVRRLLEAGIDGVVLDAEFEDTLGLVVRSVCAGMVALPRSMRHAIDPPVLAPADREILAHVVRGLSNAEIAEHLFLARSTVASRLTHIFRTLGVQSRSEAVSLVLAGDESLLDGVVPRREQAQRKRFVRRAAG